MPPGASTEIHCLMRSQQGQRRTEAYTAAQHRSVHIYRAALRARGCLVAFHGQERCEAHARGAEGADALDAGGSHFSWEASDHQLLIVDIQGVGDFYTDPQAGRRPRGCCFCFCFCCFCCCCFCCCICFFFFC
jgi:hypothetical protein